MKWLWAAGLAVGVASSIFAATASQCDLKPLLRPPVRLESDADFGSTGQLGDYSFLKVSFSGRKRNRILYDRSRLRMVDELAEAQKPVSEDPKKPTYLRLGDVAAILRTLESQPTRYGWPPLVKNPFRAANSLTTLDELKVLGDGGKGAWLTIAAQHLLEHHTKTKSRLMFVKDAAGREKVAVVTKGKDGYEQLYPFISEENSDGDKVPMPDLVAPTVRPVGFPRIKIVEATHTWKDKDPIRPVTLFAPSGKKIGFSVMGGSPAAKKFEAQEKAFEKAGPDDLVPLEFLYHPFYPPFGHTSVRIGNKSYEFGSHGWRGHLEGRNDASGHIMNYAFFKTQDEKFRGEGGVSPFTVGIEFAAPKHKVEAFRADLMSKISDANEVFSLYLNNCNHVMIRALEKAGIIEPNQFGKMEAFSSSITSSWFAHDRVKRVTPSPIVRNVYPLQGGEVDINVVRELMPKNFLNPSYNWKYDLREKLMFYSRGISKPRMLLDLFQALFKEP